MGGLSVKKKEERPTRESAALAGVFTDSSVAARHALPRKLLNCSYSSIAPNLGEEPDCFVRWNINDRLMHLHQQCN